MRVYQKFVKETQIGDETYKDVIIILIVPATTKEKKEIHQKRWLLKNKFIDLMEFLANTFDMEKNSKWLHIRAWNVEQMVVNSKSARTLKNQSPAPLGFHETKRDGRERNNYDEY